VWFLLAIFVSSIALAVILKLCSVHLDEKTTPIYMSVWPLIFGLIGAYFYFYPLLYSGTQNLMSHPIAWSLCLLKSGFYWYGCRKVQQLREYSLSSTLYVMPLSLVFAAVVNYFLGETMNLYQWCGVLGLSIIGFLFFFKGHLQTLNFLQKKWYFEIVIITTIMICIDHYVISYSNWYVLLMLTSLMMVILSLVFIRDISIWKKALFNPYAVIAAIFFTLYEFVKFYPMVTLLPVSSIVAVETSAIPIIFIITALVWKEGKVTEQLLWGILSMLFTGALLLGAKI